ncbi:MAG: cell surface protein, partial [Rikenellaceae bacterium]
VVKFNPLTNVGWRVGTELYSASSDCYLAFNPNNYNELYMCYNLRSVIYKLDLTTYEHTLVAGAYGTAGYADGEASEALFKYPRQIAFDDDGTLYVADGGNHCIRAISPDGMVSTFAGMPEASGYRDGVKEVALFNYCDGIALDSKGNMYVADMWNSLIRKIEIY